MNRRSFVRNAAVLPFALGAMPTLNSLLAGTNLVTSFHAPSKMRIGLNAYSFSKELNRYAKSDGSEGMSLFQLVDYCVDPAHRFDAVDITAYYFPNYSASEATVPSSKFIKEVKHYASDAGIAISGTGVGNSFTGVPFDREGKKGIVFSTHEGGDRKVIETDIRRIKAWIEVAAELGAPVVRVFAGLEPSYLMAQHIKPNDPRLKEKAKKLEVWRRETFKHMVEDLREVAEHGRKYKVLVGIQNHGDFLKTAEEVIEVVKAVDSPWFGVIVDTGYFLTPDPYVDVEKVIPYGVNFQIKEYVRVSPDPYMTSGFQPIDLERLMRIIRRQNYKGFLPIETLSAGKDQPYEPFKEIPPFLKKVRESVVATG